MGKLSIVMCGVTLLVSAGAASATQINVAIISAIGNSSFDADVVSKIQANTSLLNISIINALTSTPIASDLERDYAAIMVIGDNPFLNAKDLGNTVATYLSDGHGVVIMSNTNVYSNCNNPLPTQLCGNFESDHDWAIDTGNKIQGHQWLGTFNSSDPIFAGVSAGALGFDGGSLSYRVNAQVDPAATPIASWNDGTPFAATRVFPKGNLEIALNFYPVSDSMAPGQAWLHTTQGGLIMANAFVQAASVTADASDTPETANFLAAATGLTMIGLLLRRRGNATMR